MSSLNFRVDNWTSLPDSVIPGHSGEVGEFADPRERLIPVDVCDECNRFSLSEAVVCKGSNTIENKGKMYQVVRSVLRLDMDTLTQTASVSVQQQIQQDVP